MPDFRLLRGDCLELMPTLEANSIDAIVSDPPYGLDFMGHEWDHGVPGEPFWRAALRVAKPGAHLVAFGGSRLYHRLTVGIEDAGWEIRDGLMWLYGTGFPKSLDVSKAIDKSAGAEREPIREVVEDLFGPREVSRRHAGDMGGLGGQRLGTGGGAITDAATEEARRWRGWGTALKPGWEPIILARKPLGGTVADAVRAHGTGALNIEGCRLEATDGYADNAVTQGVSGDPSSYSLHTERRTFEPGSGRWPANVLLDSEAAGMLDRQVGEPVSRFFYCAKASRGEREVGLEGREAVVTRSGLGGAMPVDDEGRERDRFSVLAKNFHPTVKPVSLMRWLCRLVTPPGGLILDPFTGSGSTGVAAMLEGFSFVGCELGADYADLAEARIAQARTQPSLWEGA